MKLMNITKTLIANSVTECKPNQVIEVPDNFVYDNSVFKKVSDNTEAQRIVNEENYELLKFMKVKSVSQKDAINLMKRYGNFETFVKKAKFEDLTKDLRENGVLFKGFEEKQAKTILNQIKSK